MSNEIRMAPDAPQWWWCLHCERVNHGAKPEECPHGDCDGGWIDMWRWSEVRKDEGDGGYPLIPDPAMVYPMYADTQDGMREAYPATGGDQ